MTGGLSPNSRISLTGIRASAGSGKTYSLTTSYLRAFFAGAEADSILATTFTRTAAAEILGRVLRRMAQACDDHGKLLELARDLDLPGLDRDEVRMHLRRFCRSLDRVAIGTIDSFFSGIASCYRFEAPIPIGGAIADDNGNAAKRLRFEALRNLLAMHDRGEFLETIDRLQGGASVRSIVGSLDRTLADLLPLYEATDEACWEFPNLPPMLSEDEIEAAIDRLAALGVPTRHASYIKAMQADLQRAIDRDWAQFAGKGLAGKVAAGEVSYYNNPIMPQAVSAYQPLIDHANAAVLADLAAKTKATYNLLKILAVEYDKLRRARGMAFYSDVPIALARLMVGDVLSDVAHRIDRRIDHLMLDEFQDTDPRQWKILSRFASQIRDTAGPSGSVFWVGDIKQAIYGWRGARAGIFENLAGEYPGLNWRSLNKSFRSSQIVLDAVNGVFTDLADSDVIDIEHKPAVEAWCKGYEKHEAQFDRPGCVSIIESPFSADAATVNFGDDESDEIETSYVSFTAARIKELYDKAPGRSMGVLPRTNSMVDALLFQLKTLDVPATALAGAPLMSDPAGALVIDALALADRPGDTRAAFRVLNSPLAPVLGLTDLDPRTLRGVSLRIRRSLTGEGFAATLVHWAHVLAPHCDARGASRLALLVELADEFDQHPGTRPRDFIDIARDSDCMDPTPAPVQVMSIHKAKGLEFDSVVLPELHKALFRPTPRVLTKVDPKTHEVIGVSNYVSKGVAALDPRLGRMYGQYRDLEMRESLCVLYVALTRARYGLTIVAPAPSANKKPPFSLLSIVRARIQNSGDPNWFAGLDPVESKPATKVISSVPAASIPEAGHRIRRAQAPSSVQGWGKVRADQLLADDSREGMLTGSIIHSMFQQIEWIEDGAPDDDTLICQAQRACRQAKPDRVCGQVAPFRQMLANAGVRTALSRPDLPLDQTMQLWRERRFATFIDGSYVAGIFDRVVVFYQGDRPIGASLLDYKTGDLAKKTPEAESAKYKIQMSTYRTALSEMLCVPADALEVKILFTNTGDTVAM